MPLGRRIELFKVPRYAEEQHAFLQPGHDARQKAIFPGCLLPQIDDFLFQCRPGTAKVLDGLGSCAAKQLTQRIRKGPDLPSGHEKQHDAQGDKKPQGPEERRPLMDTHAQAKPQEQHRNQTDQRTPKKDWQPRSVAALSFLLVHAH